MTTELFFASLRRYWYVVLAGLVLGALLGLAVGAVAPKKYEGKSLVLLSAPSINELSEGSAYVESRMPTYAALVTSRPVLDRAGRSLGLDDPASITDKQVSAEVEDQTLLIELTAEAASPQAAAKLANAVAESFEAIAPRLDNSENRVLEVNVVEEATPPVRAAGFSLPLLIAMGSVLGLTLGLVAALARSTFSRAGSADPADHSTAGAKEGAPGPDPATASEAQYGRIADTT